MKTELHYGDGASCILEEVELTYARPKQAPALRQDEIVTKVRRGLAKPQGYPPLASATVPGDQVALALDFTGEGFQYVVHGALQGLQEAGIDPSATRLVLPHDVDIQSERYQVLVNLCPPELKLEIHNPDDENQLSFLGATQDGRPLRLNRTLCEADLVLPITVSQNRIPADPAEPTFHGLFPRFSDREAHRSFASPIELEDDQKRGMQLEDVDQAGWLLGLQLMIRCIPAPGAGVADIVVGEAIATRERADRRYRDIWFLELPERSDLVILMLAGNAHQTWQNIGRAVAAAEGILEPGGSIAIYSDLADMPGHSLSHLIATDLDSAEYRIQRDRHSDSRTAMQLCRALQQGTVYLRSQLPDQLVEELGLATISCDEELQKLIQYHRFPLVMEEAQRLAPSLGRQDN